MAQYHVGCGACDHMLSLPGIIPSKNMLKECGWKFCPYCGLKFESEGVKNAE